MVLRKLTAFDKRGLAFVEVYRCDDFSNSLSMICNALEVVSVLGRKCEVCGLKKTPGLLISGVRERRSIEELCLVEPIV